jgi:hypothetical protein
MFTCPINKSSITLPNHCLKLKAFTKIDFHIFQYYLLQFLLRESNFIGA